MSVVLATIAYTGVPVDWVVPAGNTTIRIWCAGAEGYTVPHSYQSNVAGKGGAVTCDLTVTPGETLRLRVGGYGGSGGWNGGGLPAGGVTAGTGGGASDIRQGGDTLADRVIVGPGGGGTAGINAVGNSADGGDGRTPTGEDGGPGVGWGDGYGRGATASAGGAGGSLYSGRPAAQAGTAGTLGQGGTGGRGYWSGSLTFDPGGGGGGGGGLYGGGGGYWGGGGGASPSSSATGSGGGGGGGSSYTDGSCSAVVHTVGVGVVEHCVIDAGFDGRVDVDRLRALAGMRRLLRRLLRRLHVGLVVEVILDEAA